MTRLDEGRRERVVAAFLVAFAVGATAPLPAVLRAGGESGVLAASVGVAVGVALVVAAGVQQSDALSDALAAPRFLLLPGVAIAAWTLGAFVDPPASRPTALAPFAVAYAGCVLGVAAWVLARDAHDRRRREAASTVASFDAPLPPRARRAMALGGAVTVAGSLVAAVGTGVGGDAVLAASFLPLASAGVVFVALSRTDREVRVADEGLFVNRSRRSWGNFESVQVADGVLVVDASNRWRGTLRFDATAIDDVDRVVAAIRERVDGDATEARPGGQSSPDS